MTAAAVSTWEPSDAPAPSPPLPCYANLHDFFGEYLAPMIRRRDGGGRRWCSEWWRHPEAVARLTALWHAWETLRLEGGTAMSDWWIHHFDPHFFVLADAERGPFQACGDGHKDKLKALPNDPLPLEWRAAWGLPSELDDGRTP